MTEPDERTTPARHPPTRRRWPWIGASALGLALLVSAILFLRPTARLNRLFGAVGLARIPPSAQHVQVGKRGRFLGTKTVYIRFEASAAEAVRFVEDSPMTAGNEPVPLAHISFGPRCPAWMTWEATVDGRMYHGSPGNASVWLAIDDESHTIYVGVFEFRPPWLPRLLE
jgi:hypothetical protein